MWQIPRVILNQILSHAQQSLPNECVGVLSGQQQTILHCHPLANTLTSPSHFLADPQEQITLFRSLREQNLQPVAIYHSHPSASVEPSQLDLDASFDHDWLYLVISLSTQGRLEMAGYLIHDKKAEPQPITIV